MQNMKTYIKVFTLMILGVLAISCDTNDPLSELGEKGEKAPSIRLGGIESLYNAGDTITYSAYYWSTSDNFESLQPMLGDNTVLSGTLTVDDGSGELTISVDSVFENEIVAVGEKMAHNPLDYRTSLNNYVKSLEYIVPTSYQLWEIAEVSEENFAQVNELSFGAEIQTLILNELAANGVSTSWANLHTIATAVDLKIESNLQIQVLVAEQDGTFNESSEYGTKISTQVEE